MTIGLRICADFRGMIIAFAVLHNLLSWVNREFEESMGHA